MQSNRFRKLLLASILAATAPLHADWQATGETKLARISGKTADLSAAVSLDVPAPGSNAALRFGPVPVDPSARELNVEAEILSEIPEGKSFRLTLLLTSENIFPERAEQILTRTNRQLKGDERGIIGFNATPPRDRIPGKPLNAFFELSSADSDRSGKPGAPAHGKVSIRDLNLLTSILPASPSTDARCRSYLRYAGRSTIAGSPGRINNKTALRLPGLLASIVGVRDSRDQRIARFMDETCRILKGLRENNSRLGPFEIYFPIANHVAAKRILGAVLTEHPAYKDYEKMVCDFQSSWSDYKSNGYDPPKRPIREAKTIADVPAGIDNGNFRLLVTAAGYLAAQEFPDFHTVIRDPKTGAEHTLKRDVILREMDLYIRRVYHSITTRNTWEYGSQTYLAIDFAPIRMIAESAKDPEIKQIATRTLDWMYSSLAASLNQGHYINSAARSKGEFLGTGSGMGFVGWLAFDSGRDSQGTTTPFNVYSALPGTYRIPQVIRPHGSFPFVKREKIGEDANIVGVYSYQSRSFGMTNSIESRSPRTRSNPNWDRDGFYKESARHKLNWLGEYSGGFSPQWQNSAQPYAERRNQLNGRNYGLNPWSLVIQNRGTQIGISDVRDGYPFRQLYVTYPMGDLRARIVKADSGWTLCHTGRVVFAFRSLKPATRTGDPWPDKSSLTDRYDYKKTAWILEAVESPETAGRKSDASISSELEKFHQSLLRATVKTTHLEDSDKDAPTLAYTSPISGKTLMLDASIYPVPADGEGIPITSYPVIATYPDEKTAPRILQENDRLQWLDGDGKPSLSHDFSPWIK